MIFNCERETLLLFVLLLLRRKKMPVQALLKGTKLFLFRREGEEESRFEILEHIGSGTFGNTRFLLRTAS